jgi:hypothetical protein
LLNQSKGKIVDLASWKNCVSVKSQIPKLSLGDKCGFQGGNDRTLNKVGSKRWLVHKLSRPIVLRVYVKRNRERQTGNIHVIESERREMGNELCKGSSVIK